MSRIFKFSWIWALILLSQLATAALPEEEYKAMLRIAQQKVNRLNALRQAGSSSALSTSLIRNVLGRYYQVGDVWDVLGCKERSSMAAMNGDAVQYHFSCAVFRYEVTEIKPGTEPQVRARITQREEFGLKHVDPAVSAIDVTMSDKFAQSQKLYHFTNLQTFSASSNGVHTSTSALELYPLDVPDIYSAERSAPTILPAVPEPIQKLAQTAGYSPAHVDLSKSSWFEQQDLFGREIQVLWQRGDLWPAYMKTPTGIAVLIHR